METAPDAGFMRWITSSFDHQIRKKTTVPSTAASSRIFTLFFGAEITSTE
ncbi:hypothetical protein [Paenibacillus sp. 1P03SA]